LKVKFTFLTLFLGSFGGNVFSQANKPNDRWFIQPHVTSGYTIGKTTSGWGYGYGLRVLYDFERNFLGGPLFLGMETSFLSPLAFKPSEARNPVSFNRQNYIVISPMLEQNYSWLKNGFTVGTGISFYKGIQDQTKNAAGLITNIGWFPIYKGKAVTPYITYRNDWVFDKNGTNMQSLSVGLNF